MAIKLLQRQKQFANFVIGDETWVYYFEPIRTVSNEIWATTHSKRPIVVKRSLSAKKVLYVIFFSGKGVATKVLVKIHHRKVLQRRSTEENWKSIIRNDTLPLVSNMSIFYMIYPFSYICNSYGVFEERKSNCLASHPPPPPPRIPQTLPPCDFFVSPRLESFLLGGNISSDMHLHLPCISTVLLCPNQRTVTPSRSGYIGWNFALLATGSTSRVLG